jgi:dynactin complex subunit
MAGLQVGQRVVLSLRNLKGTVRFIGETKFAPGKWIGVELDEPEVRLGPASRSIGHHALPRFTSFFFF